MLVGAGTAVAVTGPHTEQTDVLNHTITALTVTAGAGDITVHTGGRSGQVEVTRKTRASSLPALGADVWKGDALSLDCGPGCNVTYDIRVPDDVAVTARTDSGDVDLEGSLGRVDLQTGSGDVDAKIDADTLTTRSTSGDVKLRLAVAPSQLSATSESGDVEIRRPEGRDLRCGCPEHLRRPGHRGIGPGRRRPIASRSEPCPVTSRSAPAEA